MIGDGGPFPECPVQKSEPHPDPLAAEEVVRVHLKITPYPEVHRTFQVQRTWCARRIFKWTLSDVGTGAETAMDSDSNGSLLRQEWSHLIR
jgi:hypothetical protein